MDEYRGAGSGQSSTRRRDISRITRVRHHSREAFVGTTPLSSRYTTTFSPASDAARSYLPHRYPEVVGPNHEANDALPPQELREREGEQPSAKPEKRSQASFINIVFCHDRPPFRIPDALDYTSLRMPNANTVTRLGQTFAKRSLLLRTKDDHPIVKDLRKRRLQVQMKRHPEVGERVEAEEDAEVIADRQVMRIGGFLRGDLLGVERPSARTWLCLRQLWEQARLCFALLEPVPVPHAMHDTCPRILSAACHRVSSKPSVALFLFTSLFRNTYAPLRWHLLALATRFYHDRITRPDQQQGAVSEPPLPSYGT